MQSQGWVLLFHDCIVQQLTRLQQASENALSRDPEADGLNANVKLFSALSRLILEVIPADPGHESYRQGNTLGAEHRHWRRAKIGQRFRLFFRYDSRAKVIIYAWVNDTNSLRAAGSVNDPYAIFKRMLESGNPPGEWDRLLESSKSDWTVQEQTPAEDYQSTQE